MTALLLNWRQAAGYTILAPTVEVAANAFNPARDMVRRDDDLDDLCQVQTHIRTITHRVDGHHPEGGGSRSEYGVRYQVRGDTD